MYKYMSLHVQINIYTFSNAGTSSAVIFLEIRIYIYTGTHEYICIYICIHMYTYILFTIDRKVCV
jgi:hypothetical protein